MFLHRSDLHRQMIATYQAARVDALALLECMDRVVALQWIEAKIAAEQAELATIEAMQQDAASQNGAKA